MGFVEFGTWVFMIFVAGGAVTGTPNNCDTNSKSVCEYNLNP